MKIFGSLLIILTSIVISHIYDKRQKEKILAIKELLEFISFVKIQIEYFSLPLNTIYTKYNNNSHYVSNLIKEKPLEILDRETADELTKCISCLGKGFKKEQIEYLEYITSFLSKKITDNESNYQQKTKVFRAISLFVGCCVVILLV